MPRTWIELSDELKSVIEEQAERENIGVNPYIERLLGEALTMTRPDLYSAPPPPAPVDESAVADFLLGQLEPGFARLVTTIAREKRVGAYHLFLSYIQTALQRGEASEITQEATRRAQLGTAQAATLGTVPCAWCKQPFQQTAPGQLYCPDPEDGRVGCGRQAMLAELHARRPQGKRGDEEYSPTQVPADHLARMMQERRMAGTIRAAG